MAAQASWDGDFGTSASLTQSMRQRALDARQRSQLGMALHNLGYGDDQIMVALSDPGSLGRNFNERLGTRVVAPGSSIVTGGPAGQQAAYSQPNAWEAYAKAQGLRPGTADYNTALQDYILRSNGPTAFGYDTELDDHRTANDRRIEADRQAGRVGLERLRQQGRIGLEDARQGNRVTTRQTPSYRDLHPRPAGTPRGASAPRVPTATDDRGNTIYYRNGQWVDAQGRGVR
jgi:hypothetical protein